MVDAVLDPERKLLVAAIDRGRGRVDEMPRAPLPRELKHVHVPDEVGAHIGAGVVDAVAYPGLRPEVDDPVEVAAIGQAGELVGLGEVDLAEAEAVAEILRQPIQARLLERRVVIIVEVVDPDHLVAPF